MTTVLTKSAFSKHCNFSVSEELPSRLRDAVVRVWTIALQTHLNPLFIVLLELLTFESALRRVSAYGQVRKREDLGLSVDLVLKSCVEY